MTAQTTRLAAMLATAAGLALGLGLLTLASPKVGLAGAVALVVLAAAVYGRSAGWRAGLLCLLIATSFIDRYTYRAASVDVRPEQIAAIIAAGAVVYCWATQRPGWAMWRPSLAETLLGVWIAVALVSSVTAAPNAGRSVKGVALLAVCSLGFLLPRRVLSRAGDRSQADLAVSFLLLVFAAEAAYGMAAFLAHIFGSTVSLGANVASGHLNALGTLWEPNVFGAFCAAGSVAWTWLGPRHFKLSWLGIAVCLGGLIASFTRTAWLAAAVFLALSALAPRMRSRTAIRPLILGVAGAFVIGLVVLGAEQVGNYYVALGPGGTATPARHGLLALLENPIDIIGRADQFKIAAPDLRAHVLLGNGVASFGERHPVAGQPEQHLANLELALLNDTGALGLAAFVGFAIAIAVAAWHRRRDSTVAGLGVTVLLLALTNTGTETTELMITWLVLGLLVMAVELAKAVEAPV